MPSLSKLVFALLLCLLGASNPAPAQTLPPDLQTLLTQAGIPPGAVALSIVDAANPHAAPIAALRADALMNPASTMKLVTSVVALELLGPRYRWQTKVWFDPPVHHALKHRTQPLTKPLTHYLRGGTLYGNLVIQGGGDPKLSVEQLWLLLQRVRSLGIRTIRGDIVLDQSAFAAIAKDPAAFDGEPQRPYNAVPEALLINFKSVVMTFTPNLLLGAASIHYDPPLAGVQMPAQVALDRASPDCPNYRAALKADFSQVNQIRFNGSYPYHCGERVWAIAYSDPSTFASRAVQGMWKGIGGRLSGTVRSSQPSPQALFLLAYSSPPLADVIRGINQFSNNVMAQQLFLTLSLDRTSAEAKAASFAASREITMRWWNAAIAGGAPAPEAPEIPIAPLVLDNGSGLSRDERITARGLARLLQRSYGAPYMPELMASLPQIGGGTLRSSQAVSSAHLKTGTLANVAARAGYVDGAHGKRWVLVVMVNSDDPSVIAASAPVMDALVDWTARQ